jgi:hypothetical protein
MAKTYEYTPRRRVVMQIAMFGILLGTVGLAALVDEQIVGKAAAALGPEQTLGALHFRLPEGWVAVGRSRRAPGASAIVRENGGPAETERTLVLYRQHIPSGMSPQESLDRMGLVSDVFGDVE